MTIGSDQLDAWGKTLIECDELYRELQLLIRINPEAYTVDSTALAAVGVANADAYDDGGMDHPIAFARRWAWHLAAENKGIPPITNAWVPLIRYVSAHLQYLTGDDRELFGQELRRLRGLLGALVNENGLSQGEEVMLAALKGRDARATHADAWQFAENVADYARCIRFKRDLARTKAAIDRMERR